MAEVKGRVSQMRAAISDASDGAMLHPVHILLAEDDKWERKEIERLLIREGYKVTTAKAGKEALDILIAGNGIELVLTGTMMPKQDDPQPQKVKLTGIQLATKIGKTRALQHLPVVVMSDAPPMAEMQEAFAVGAADFLAKPIRKEEVIPLWRHVSGHVWRRMQAIAGAVGAKAAAVVHGGWLHGAWPACDEPDAAAVLKAEDLAENLTYVATYRPGGVPSNCTRLAQLCAVAEEHMPAVAMAEDHCNMPAQMQHAQMQPAGPAPQAQVPVQEDLMAKAGSLTESDGGTCGAFHLRAATPPYAQKMEAPVECWSERKGTSRPDYAALARVGSAPCLLSVLAETSNQQSTRRASRSLKRGREAVEPLGSADMCYKKQNVGVSLFRGTSADSGTGAETGPVEQSSPALPRIAARVAEGSMSVLDTSRCASLGVRPCILTPVNLEIAPLDLGLSSRSGAFCTGWQVASGLALPRKPTYARQPDDSACALVYGGRPAPREQGNRSKGREGGSIKGGSPAKDHLHHVLGGRVLKGAADTQVASGDPTTCTANRKAAMQRYRAKKLLRSFQKVVRYESRQKLAESRPRVRGQFVKRGTAALAD